MLSWNQAHFRGFGCRQNGGTKTDAIFRPDVRADFYDQDVAVKLLRFRIAWVMVAVAIAALDFGLIRAILGPRTGNLHPETCILLVLGALPMANVLAVGMLVGQRRPASHPFLLGFEAFGMLALAFYISLAIFFSREVVMHYLEPLIALMEKIIGRDRPFVFFSILFFGSVVMLGCPQVAFALIGGSLSRRFRITITRR